MIHNKLKAALFDLDGVVIDTEGIYSIFWSQMAKDYDVPIPNFADYIKGTTLKQILGNNFPETEHTAIIDRLKVFENEMEYRTFPGIMEFLAELKRRGIPAAIVTSSGQEKMANLWRQQPHLKEMFSAIITDADVQRSKPDPQGYILGAEACGCDPKECYVFEDSYNGLEAGRRSGAKVIGLPTTNPKEEVAKRCDKVIDGFDCFTVDEMLSI